MATFETVEKYSERYFFIHRNWELSRKLDITKIEWITNNSHLENEYEGESRKLDIEEDEEELFVFHGTTAENAARICFENLDTSHCVRGLYGKGFYFSPSSGYASFYPTDDNEGDRVMVGFRILLGKSREVSSPRQVGDVSNIDTVCVMGEGDFEGTPKSCLKFDPKQCYPVFLMTYRKISC